MLTVTVPVVGVGDGAGERLGGRDECKNEKETTQKRDAKHHEHANTVHVVAMKVLKDVIGRWLGGVREQPQKR